MTDRSSTVQSALALPTHTAMINITVSRRRFVTGTSVSNSVAAKHIYFGETIIVVIIHDQYEYTYLAHI